MKSELEYLKEHRKKIDRLFDKFNLYLDFEKEYSVGSKVVQDFHLVDNAPEEAKKAYEEWLSIVESVSIEQN